MAFFGLFGKKSKEEKESLDQGLQKTKMGIFEKISRAIVGKSTVDDDVLDGIEEALIASDIGVDTTLKIIDSLQERVARDKFMNTEELNSILREEIEKLLNITESDSSDDSEEAVFDFSKKPYVIMVVGVNGVGKTTTIGKLASRLKNSGKKVVLGAADTFRAAAVDQLEVWAERANADFFKGSPEQDPASVVFDAAEHLKNSGKDVLICDTAGRLQNKKTLMEELSKIHRVLKRQTGCEFIESLLVVEAATGQNAVLQAESFNEVAGLTGIVLTKLDGTSKGGVIIPLVQKTNLPIKLVGVGEQIEDLMEFDPQSYAQELF